MFCNIKRIQAFRFILFKSYSRSFLMEASLKLNFSLQNIDTCSFIIDHLPFCVDITS